MKSELLKRVLYDTLLTPAGNAIRANLSRDELNELIAIYTTVKMRTDESATCMQKYGITQQDFNDMVLAQVKINEAKQN